MILLKNILFAYVLVFSGTDLFAMGLYTSKNAQIKQLLNEQALTNGYGYKYANLKLLKDFIKQESLTKLPYKLAVPEFVGVSSDQVKKFLSAFDINTKWQTVVSQQKDKQVNTAFSEAFLTARSSFKKNLSTFFDTLITHVPSLNAAFTVTDLDTVIGKKEKLMVRSTGKEDTEESSNAGGNASVPNVDPTIKDILAAIKTVVLSYFSKKSLIQRLGAGDLSVFDHNPFVPFLVQRMIGEKNNKPTGCGVMFTEEQEGSVSAKFRIANKAGSFDVDPNGINPKTGQIKTSGITLIQAAYGHNEAVVNSKIPVDTYYIDLLGVIFSVIRNKTHRLKPDPTQSRVLKLVENDAQIAAQPALNFGALQTLNALAKKLEQYYLRPMDVEFVVDEQEKTIYIVQARPLVPGKKKIQPSYLKNIDAFKSEKLSGTAIGVAGGALHIITDPAQIVVADTINKGLSNYQNHANKAAVKVVIIGKMAPSTSHEATILRSEQKAVLYIPEWSTVTAWADKAQTDPLVIDVQQGAVIKWSEPIKTVDQLITQGKALIGWSSYPVPRALTIKSIDNAFNRNLKKSTLKERDKKLKEIPQYSTLINEFFTERLVNGKKVVGISLPKILKSLKKDEAQKARVALNVLFSYVSQVLTKLGGSSEQSAQNLIAWFTESLTNCAYCMWNTLNFGTNHELYSERLFYIRMLEALLYQQKLIDVRLAYSLATFLKLLPQEHKIAQKGITQPYAVQLIQVGEKVALTDTVQLKWENFIKNLGSNTQTVQSLAQMIANLANLEIIPTWLNVIFDKTIGAGVTNESTAKNKLQELITTYNNDKVFLAELLKKKSELGAFNKAVFEQPKLFDAQWKLWQGYLTYFNNNFITQFQKAQQIGKFAALSLMNTFVDIYDGCIKAVTGSTMYDDAALQAKNALIMVSHYANLFLQWLPLLQEDQDADRLGKELRRKQFIEIFQEALQVVTKKTKNKDLLKPTSDFRVNVMAFGTGNNIKLKERFVQPSTIEDIFTWSHQNLIQLISFLGKDLGLATIQLPPLVEQIQTFLKIGKKLVSVNFDGENLRTTYNIPLANHSLQYQIIYHKKTTKKPDWAELTINLFGDNDTSFLRGGRWDQIGNFLLYHDMVAKDLTVKKEALEISESHLSATVILSQISEDNEKLFYGLLNTSLRRLADGDSEYRIPEKLEIGEGYVQAVCTLFTYELNRFGVEHVVNALFGHATLSGYAFLYDFLPKFENTEILLPFFQLTKNIVNQIKKPVSLARITESIVEFLKDDKKKNLSIRTECLELIRLLAIKATELWAQYGEAETSLANADKDDLVSQDRYRFLRSGDTALFEGLDYLIKDNQAYHEAMKVACLVRDDINQNKYVRYRDNNITQILCQILLSMVSKNLKQYYGDMWSYLEALNENGANTQCRVALRNAFKQQGITAQDQAQKAQDQASSTNYLPIINQLLQSLKLKLQLLLNKIVTLKST